MGFGYNGSLETSRNGLTLKKRLRFEISDEQPIKENADEEIT
jgi:hypothetical protein